MRGAAAGKAWPEQRTHQRGTCWQNGKTLGFVNGNPRPFGKQPAKGRAPNGPKLSDGGWRRKSLIQRKPDRQPPFAGARG